MSSRHQAPLRRTKDNQGGFAQPVRTVAAQARRRSSPRSGSRKQGTWFLLLVVLLGLITLVTLARAGGARQGQGAVTPPPSAQMRLSARAFQAYAFPRPENEVMRPAIDRKARLWFGAMGQNALVVFDPRTHTFGYLTPPHGHHGIMGVQVAPDDTIWFAEQSANYLGHYFPATGRYRLYPLPWLSIPDPAHPGQMRSLPSAPNELALDAQGEVWFTEFNADRLGRLDPHTDRMQHYALSAKASVQTLYPYGVIIDAEGMVWFTESGTNRLGRLDPATGAMRLFTAPDPHALLMEIASDTQGSIWVTSFTPGLLFRLHPGTGTFTSYLAPAQGSERSALYGLLVTKAGEVWVTMLEENALARLDVAAQRFLTYQLPRPNSQPLGLVMDAGHALWFTGVDAVGMVRP